MSKSTPKSPTSTGSPHAVSAVPSEWVLRFAETLPPEARILDLACGSGRHLRWFIARGHRVTGVDRTLEGLSDLSDVGGLERVQADLEDGSPWPLANRRFDLVVVTNYLHRPLFPDIAAAVAPGGLLVYETFAAGNERFGRPSNPDFLLRPGELLDWLRPPGEPSFHVLAYEDVLVEHPRPAAVQRIAATALVR